MLDFLQSDSNKAVFYTFVHKLKIIKLVKYGNHKFTFKCLIGYLHVDHFLCIRSIDYRMIVINFLLKRNPSN